MFPALRHETRHGLCPRRQPFIGRADPPRHRCTRCSSRSTPSVKGAWEDLFERPYGFWRGILDGVVARTLDCGIFERGLARIRCPDCATEFLLAFSCKGRGLCPSCDAKRAAEIAAFLQDEVVADVRHAGWVFTVSKLLRTYFMHHRELLGSLCAAALKTVRELMAAAVDERGFRPGMVAMVLTFGGQLNIYPHVHALVTRSGWSASGEWAPVAYVETSSSEQRFRHKVIRLLQRAGLLDEDRTRLLLSFSHSRFFVPRAKAETPEPPAPEPSAGFDPGSEFEPLMRTMPPA